MDKYNASVSEHSQVEIDATLTAFMSLTKNTNRCD